MDRRIDLETSDHLLALLAEMERGGQDSARIRVVDRGYLVEDGWRGRHIRLGTDERTGALFLEELLDRRLIAAQPEGPLLRVGLTGAGRRCIAMR